MELEVVKDNTFSMVLLVQWPVIRMFFSLPASSSHKNVWPGTHETTKRGLGGGGTNNACDKERFCGLLYLVGIHFSVFKIIGMFFSLLQVKSNSEQILAGS